MLFYKLTSGEAAKKLNTDIINGLSKKEAAKRLKIHGKNLLPEKKKPPIFLKFLEQFKNILVLILLIATLISFLLGDTLDAVAIACIVLLNASISFLQEMQAEKTMESLKQKEIHYALVLRDGSIEKVPFPDLVPGDVIILEEGSKIPADARIVESYSLRIEESILTGESKAVNKHDAFLSGINIPLGDQRNVVFKDTEVMAGRGKAIIYSTGKDTEIGKIAQFLKEKQSEKTPLSVELDYVGKMLTVMILFVAGIIFGINFFTNKPLVESILISISLSVAAIPEGLPAITTIVLSIGVKRLSEKFSLVKKLAACETLGAVRIIATDKTGTLTQNKINAVKAILPSGKSYGIEGEGYSAEGIFTIGKSRISDPLKDRNLIMLLRAGTLASNASVNAERHIIGDTTEGALVVAAERAGLDISEIRTNEPKVFEVPFTAERKMMSVIVKVDDTDKHVMYSKGAPEVMFEKLNISSKEKSKLLEITKGLAKEGLRSLAVCMRDISKKEVDKALEKDTLDETGLKLLGIIGMQDPLRLEVKEALRNAKIAGIRTIMITGDHKLTAGVIARQAGIISEGDEVYTEEDIMHLTTEGLAEKIKKGASVYARISPMGKLKIIKAIKSIPRMQVAVTGDGVNDAPALKESHIGIAMGKTGTDLTREVADMVILDDNYATIVTAVREGRVIFANLVKFIRYLISCNISEVLIVAAAVVAGLPVPLIPIQLLWLNLITDGLPALALGVDPPEYDVMKKPPRDLSKGLLYKKRWFYMIFEGSIMGTSVFFLFVYALNTFGLAAAQTMAFTALAFSQLTHAFNNRSVHKSIFRIGVFSNIHLVIATVFSVALQYIVVTSKTGNLIFETIPLSYKQWLLISLVSLVPLIVVEAKKLLRIKIIP